MASVPSKTLKVAAAITIAGLLALLLPSIITPLLPPLHPLTSQLLTRLREAVAFLAFTTAIAVGILSTQHKGVHHEKQNKLFLENHPLGSIFGESGYGEVVDALYADQGKHSSTPSTKKNELSHDGLQGADANSFPSPRFLAPRNDGSFSVLSSKGATGPSRTGRLPVSLIENGTVGELNMQKKLHRKSSSLDDSVVYEHELQAPEASNVSHVRTTSNEHGVFTGNKPTKRVSFSLASSPSSPTHVAVESQRDLPVERDLSASSPGDLTGQADAFIAKFKEQLRMQRLESFQRSRRQS